MCLLEPRDSCCPALMHLIDGVCREGAKAVVVGWDFVLCALALARPYLSCCCDRVVLLSLLLLLGNWRHGVCLYVCACVFVGLHR